MSTGDRPSGPGGPSGRLDVNEPTAEWAVGLLALGGLIYGAVQATHPGLDAHGLAALVVTVGLGLGWVGWLVGLRRDRPTVGVCAVALVGVCGGVAGAWASFGAVVVGVAAMCALMLVGLLPATALAGLGIAAAAVALAIDGQDVAKLAAVGVGALFGLLLGVVRRQRRHRLRSEAELAVAWERGAVEHERAELFAERNRIAREVHDVLAHTLSALSVQITALDSIVEDGAGTDEVRAAIGRSRRLVVEGLDETRRAVRALREEPVALDEQLTALATDEGADFRITGSVRPLPPAAGMALLRVAQEALTNTRKHAPGAAVAVTLAFGEASTRLTVTNEATVRSGVHPAGALAETGGGFGLTGMRERVELLGGTLDAGPEGAGPEGAGPEGAGPEGAGPEGAGPKAGGWSVEAEVPA
ncbi:sensor histidine kinase [Streptomyces antimycoticus]|uniref:sensor histidine kinase n=1 Tax=Streptomyces antimycoticus TaxID=68175 RepID=UPI0036EF0714